MLQLMNRHRHTKPPCPALASSRAGVLSSFMTERADLRDLEVRDSSWDEWVEVQMQVQAARAPAAAQPAQAAQFQSSTGAPPKGSVQ